MLSYCMKDCLCIELSPSYAWEYLSLTYDSKSAIEDSAFSCSLAYRSSSHTSRYWPIPTKRIALLIPASVRKVVGISTRPWESVSPLKALGVTQTEAELVRSEKFLGDYEISVINQLRIYFERASVKISRYRGYTNKSFSPANASRYRKAYDAYMKIYSGEA